MLTTSTVSNDDFMVEVLDANFSAPVAVLVAGQTYGINVSSIDGMTNIRGFQFHPLYGQDTVTTTADRSGTVLPGPCCVAAFAGLRQAQDPRSVPSQ